MAIKEVKVTCLKDECVHNDAQNTTCTLDEITIDDMYECQQMED